MAGEEDLIPTEEELRALPRQAVVAFAVRCAQRVRPLFDMAWPEAPADLVVAVDSAILMAEQSAATTEGAASAARAALAADAAEAFAAGHAAYSAAYAADAAYASMAASEASAHTAHAAAVHAVSAAQKSDIQGVAERIRRDYVRLHEQAEQDGWTDATIVSQKVFDPFWPDGEPEGWPA